MAKIVVQDLERMFFHHMKPYIKWFELSDAVHIHLVKIMVRMVDNYAPLTLVQMFVKAQSKDPQMEVTYWTELGDRCLFVAGCFPESIVEDGMTFEWVFGMAAAGYQAAAQKDSSIIRDQQKVLYTQLAHQVYECAWTIRETYIAIQLENTTNIQEIYDFFLRSQSMAAQRRLQQLGFILPNGEDTEE